MVTFTATPLIKGLPEAKLIGRFLSKLKPYLKATALGFRDGDFLGFLMSCLIVGILLALGKIMRKARARRDESANNNIFLEAAQRVNHPFDGRVN